ncbi:MAG: 2-oxoglutarate dehydrogenase complex dihydrolipoyllysine-residue succinyltransferase [Deltaproteobacteria bacterium]|nr:2-oxoglutarate dehydrogenase complex dihydrolipoyllysine-residue succinyltransferase [Deltaproteobacteria bacterium]
MSNDLVVPALGESITEAVIARWLKKVGEAISADEPVVDLETDKVSVQLPSPATGVLAAQRFAEGATVRVGDVIGKIENGARHDDTAASDSSDDRQEGLPRGLVERSPALSPSRRKALREQGLDLGDPVSMTAAFPAVSAALAAIQAASPSAPPAPEVRALASTVPPAPLSQVERSPREEVVPMTPLRKTIAERLVQAQHSAAILTTFNEVDMSAVMALRSRHQDAFVAKHGIKLGFMSFFVKACVAALKEFPGLNAEVRGTDIIYKKYYDIGVAVGSGRGLVVPVVRDADSLGFAEIEKKVAELGQKARDNKLSLAELSGGTFTITNGGIYGSLMSTPLLNFPQTGILGMHNIVKRPVAFGDKVEIRPMMYVALSYDHRVVDGREAVQFLVGLKERLEQPERLLVNI